jgi:hypothetical protein
MMVYKVFCKNYERRKGELMGILIERRKDLRGKTPIESGLRWAKFTFRQVVKDQKAIFVVPNELNLGSDAQWAMEKAIFSKEQLPVMVKLVKQAMKREVGS